VIILRYVLVILIQFFLPMVRYKILEKWNVTRSTRDVKVFYLNRKEPVYITN